MSLVRQTDSGRRGFMKMAALGAVAVGGLGFLRPEAASADSSEWITITATLALNPDNEEAAIKGLQELVAQVEAREPGVLAYICNRGVEDPSEIMFFEIYQNEAAAQAHGQTEHMAKFRQSAADFFVGEMKVVPYKRIAGYHR